MVGQLRFIERKMPTGDPHKGSVRRILQQRRGPMYPWADVPTYTMEVQQAEAEAAREDAKMCPPGLD